MELVYSYNPGAHNGLPWKNGSAVSVGQVSLIISDTDSSQLLKMLCKIQGVKCCE